MADYYSLISRAVAALKTNTFDDRRAVYNRARAVQSYQLGKRPFNKKHFDHERSMLEDAISRVETEATTKQIATEAPASVPVQPSNIAPTPMVPFSSVGTWLKRVFYRFSDIHRNPPRLVVWASRNQGRRALRCIQKQKML